MNKLIYLILLTVTAACTHNTPQVKQFTLPAIQQLTVIKTPPDTLLSFIYKTFPGAQVCTQADYDQSFWSFCDTTLSLPWYTAADINNDEYVDMALLVKQQQNAKLLLFLSNHTGYTWQWAEGFSIPVSQKQPLQFGLQPEPPGRIDIAYRSLQSLILRTNGINLYHFENRHAIYYWNENSIAVFRTS